MITFCHSFGKIYKCPAIVSYTIGCQNAKKALILQGEEVGIPPFSVYLSAGNCAVVAWRFQPKRSRQLEFIVRRTTRGVELRLPVGEGYARQRFACRPLTHKQVGAAQPYDFFAATYARVKPEPDGLSL